MFNAGRLVIARKRRQLTAKALAEKTGLSPVTITRLEKGENQPDDITVAKIASALSYPTDFFSADDPDEIDTESVSFRSLSKMSAKERDAATSAASLGFQLNKWVETKFDLPEPDLLDLGHESNPSIAARLMRQHWRIGDKPIANLLALLETKGIRVFSLSENTASVDAFSFWKSEKPFIFLNNFKSSERSIFDAAHELGHLVLHRHAGPKPTKPAEKEANEFAASFLMPSNDVLANMPRSISSSVIIARKKRWRVSAMALAYRLHQLNLMTEWQYKSVCIDLGRRGYRAGEPDGLERETSQVWRKILAQLWTEKITKDQIAQAINLPVDELEALIHGVTIDPQTNRVRVDPTFKLKAIC